MPAWIGCRATAPGSPAPATAAKPDPPDCASQQIFFQPRVRVWYAARTEQMHDVYQSLLQFRPSGEGWWAVERDFSMNRPTPVEYFGELRGAKLQWSLNEEGAPLSQPTPVGGAKPGYLENMSVYAFAPAGLAVSSTCVGKEWEARWEESERKRSFRYRIEGAAGDRVRIGVTGLVKTAHNEWRIEGTYEVSTEDGLTGTADLHVTGPGAPAVNDYFRRITITPIANPMPGTNLPTMRGPGGSDIDDPYLIGK